MNERMNDLANGIINFAQACGYTQAELCYVVFELAAFYISFLPEEEHREAISFIERQSDEHSNK